MATLVIKPESVCSRQMVIEYEGNVITHASVIGGCSGNLQAICRLIENQPINQVISLLEGIRCPGSRTGNTSCPDQLAKGLKSLLK
ncbi:MAG TPA: TIGR03905 family TSCPD domain-containing protein [Bacilli bacterium]|nr:TIGR03905 family TSCPD domain-containing protein [Bacilli bacterium]